MESKQPLVSIITPSFNRADVIGETAESIFRQTYIHWEWVIVDDGSTDNSWEIIEKFAQQDSRIKIFKRSRGPKGACTCRNIAIEKSTGEYLIFLDTDDLLASFCIEQRIKAVKENPAADFIIFPMLLFSRQPDDLRLLWNVETGENDLARILRSDPICQGTGTIWKKDSFIDIGKWKEDLAVWQDIELHIRALTKSLNYSKRMDLPPDTFIRISEVSLSRTGYDHIEKVKSRISVFRYALDNIAAGDKVTAVKESLKLMAFNLITGAVNSNHFTEAGTLMDYAAKENIFSHREFRKIKSYMQMRKWKGYRIPGLNNLLYKSMLKFVPDLNNSVGKIPYRNEIML
jgi:glycosyltransferase involved in cell wall biosynthesis